MSDITFIVLFQSGEAFMVEGKKHTHTHARVRAHTHTTHTHSVQMGEKADQKKNLDAI